MPKLDGILETAIHTEDMVRARAFYEGVLGLEPIYSDDRLSAYAVSGTSRFARGLYRRTQRLGTRWTQPLFPRSGRSPFGTGNARIVVDLLGTRASRATDPGRSDVRFVHKRTL